MARLTRVAVAAALSAVACRHSPAPPSILQDGPPAPPDTARAAAPSAPTVIPGAPPPTTPTEIEVGPHAACAVMMNATVRCWGAGGAGQLGDGAGRDSATPVEPDVHGVLQLALGGDHACALLDDMSIACWGQIGFGPKRGPMLVPTGVPGMHDMSRVFALGGASCATATAGPLACWGDVDARGHVTQAGAHQAPTAVPGVTNAIALAPDAALQADGEVIAWPDGAPSATKIAGGREVVAAGDGACALDASGDVRCTDPHARCVPAPEPIIHTGPHNRGHGPVRHGPFAPPPPETRPLPFGTPAMQLAFGFGTCVVTTAHALVCLDDACVPHRVLGNVVDASGACARLGDGTVRCSGAPVAGVTGATQIAADGGRGCAIAGGGVWCWEAGGAAHAIIHP